MLPNPAPAVLPRPAAPAATLAMGDAPSPWLPGLHFAVALTYFVLGSGALVLYSDHLARGSFFMPQVAAATHLFALGWIMLSIFGALYQFLPVAVGQPLRFTSLAYVGLAAHTLGLMGFIGGLVSGARGLLYLGACGLSSSFISVAFNLVATLRRADERPLTWWALLGSALFLVVTPAYGLALGLNLHGDLSLSQRFVTVASHAHVALVGIVLLVMVGVAHRLLPMFLLSHGASERPAWAALALLFGGALMLSIPYRNTFYLTAAYAMSGLGALAFLIQAALFFKRRVRRAIDPGMRLAGAGLIGLTVALLIAPFALSRGTSHPPLLSAYFVALLGAISLFIAGHYYKIVPFIVWYHRYGPLVGLQKVPKVAELYSEKLALLSGALLALGWLGLVVLTFVGSRLGVWIASLTLLTGACLEALIITRVALVARLSAANGGRSPR